MGGIRKPRCQTGRLNAAERMDARERRSNGDVEKAMDGFFNKLLVFMDIIFSVHFVHAPGVEENEADKDVNRALLCEPEAQLETSDANLI